MRMEPFVLSSRRSAKREARDAAIMGSPGNDWLGSVVGKTKTPPSGRGAVLGPAATPGEDAAAVQPTNSLTRRRFRQQLAEFCGALSGRGGEAETPSRRWCALPHSIHRRFLPPPGGRGFGSVRGGSG